VSKNVIGLTVALVFLAGCSTTGEKVVTAPIDYTGRVCESPIFKQIIGTFSGELQATEGDRFCVWDATVSVSAAVSDDQSCELEGTIATTLVQQGPAAALPYVCDVGVRDVTFVNGLQIGDDLTTVRPVSLGFNYLPFLEERDSAGNELVFAVPQFQFSVIEMAGLRAENGRLEKQ